MFIGVSLARRSQITFSRIFYYLTCWVQKHFFFYLSNVEVFGLVFTLGIEICLK